MCCLAPLLAGDAFDRGLEFARAGQWTEARREFQEGQRQFPGDKRYPIELAGVEYQLGNLGQASAYLRQALRLDPEDPYALEFLATIYFVRGNFEAALKYWNRVDKPRIESVNAMPPAPPIPAGLLQHSIAFSTGQVLTRRQFNDTAVWIDSLNAFDSFHLDLATRDGQTYDAMFRWSEVNPWIKAASALGGLPIQTVTYDFRNVGHRAILSSNLLRWDAQKRRINSLWSMPWNNDPGKRLSGYIDLRRETWNLGTPDDFRVNKQQFGASFRVIPSSRFSFETGIEVAHRSFAGTVPFTSGWSVGQTGDLGYRMLSLPEYGFTVDFDLQAKLAGFLGKDDAPYGRTQTSVEARWVPQPVGTGLETTAKATYGRVLGDAPFDEHFVLGLQRDDAVPLRGLVATRQGKKGRAPIGDQYVLLNFDFFKQIWTSDFVVLDAGPLLDIGKMSYLIAQVPPRGFVATPGAQIRLRIAGYAIVLSYARDLRGGGVFDLSLR